MEMLLLLCETQVSFVSKLLRTLMKEMIFTSAMGKVRLFSWVAFYILVERFYVH